jgi:hypothetical protein
MIRAGDNFLSIVVPLIMASKATRTTARSSFGMTRAKGGLHHANHSQDRDFAARSPQRERSSVCELGPSHALV